MLSSHYAHIKDGNKMAKIEMYGAITGANYYICNKIFDLCIYLSRETEFVGTPLIFAAGAGVVYVEVTAASYIENKVYDFFGIK